MTRISILLIALLALVVSACASDAGSSASPSEPAATTQESTAEPTESEAAESPESTAEAGDGGALADLLPDELNGIPRTEIPGLEEMLGPMLAQSGVDASAAEFVFASYGEGDDAVQVQAFRVPGMSDVQLEALARAMSGGAEGSGVSADSVTIGGKTVLQITGPQVPGGAYLYLTDGAVFTVVSQSADLAEQLVAELP